MQLNVSGMTCGHCALAITKAIKQVDPRAAVKVDVAGGTVTLTSDAPTARIAEAIQAEAMRRTRSRRCLAWCTCGRGRQHGFVKELW